MVALLPRLRRFAYALTGSADQADDLVQDTCERALARIEQWTPGTRLDSWMYRIAQNIWMDKGRAKRSRGQAVDIDTMHNLAGSDGRQITEGRLTLMAVSREMRRLSKDQQVLIALVCVEGLTYKEAADVLELPIGTVMSRLARARAALGAALDPPASDGAGTTRKERPRV
jgi:RNA polymerase sigma-70 factor (ECF subfamily)